MAPGLTSMAIYERIQEDKDDKKRNKRPSETVPASYWKNGKKRVKRSNPAIGARYRARILERLYERTYLSAEKNVLERSSPEH